VDEVLVVAPLPSVPPPPPPSADPSWDACESGAWSIFCVASGDSSAIAGGGAWFAVIAKDATISTITALSAV